MNYTALTPLRQAQWFPRGIIMKFADALKLMNEGCTITRNDKTFIKRRDNYRFTFTDRLSNKWRVHTDVFSFPAGIKANGYPCYNCNECTNKHNCPCNWRCYIEHSTIIPRPQFKKVKNND